MKTAIIPQKQKLTACALARGETITSAAELASVTRVTVHAWLRDDSVFLAYLNKLKEETLESARTQLQSASTIAVETLVDVMKKSTNDIAKINAAKEVLSMTGFTKDAGSQYGLGIGGTTQQEVEADKKAKKINDDLIASLSGVY